MLKRVDRLQMVVADRDSAAAGWRDVLGAEFESEDRVKCLGALRSTWRVGAGRVEFLVPDGTGPVAEALAKRGAHLFAAGLSTVDFNGLVARLKAHGIVPRLEGGHAYLDAKSTGDFGMQVVVSPDEELAPIGRIDCFYETTLLVQDAARESARCADVFGLDPGVFVAIGSEDYGYKGTLTLFRPGQLDRFEIITPNVPEKTMGRYFSKFGQCYYMAFAESGALPAIQAAAASRGLGHTIEWWEGKAGGTADTVFLHPPVLGGMMLGISRRSKAWQWSGNPARVEAPA